MSSFRDRAWPTARAVSGCVSIQATAFCRALVSDKRENIAPTTARGRTLTYVFLRQMATSALCFRNRKVTDKTLGAPENGVKLSVRDFAAASAETVVDPRPDPGRRGD
ncbi:hypothetical protein EVAR_43891_1 [Eumeta japonica]|uniref:Uncharacterized protein n=1 Tax=Eumeta variegata TaxID=151549 RepID=A0A4C1WPA2_EUMVA|nr:hypothetical protein EVAR_43891_1 [Eumeta japonica]